MEDKKGKSKVWRIREEGVEDKRGKSKVWRVREVRARCGG